MDCNTFIKSSFLETCILLKKFVGEFSTKIFREAQEPPTPLKSGIRQQSFEIFFNIFRFDSEKDRMLGSAPTSPPPPQFQ